MLGEKEKVLLGNWVGWRSYPCETICAAIKMGRYLFVAGEVMYNELFFEPTLEVDMPSIKRQARYAFSDYVRILNSVGASMDNVAWIQAFGPPWVIDPILEVAHEFLRNVKVAWTSTGNTGLWVPTFLCEIYGMAIVDEESFGPYPLVSKDPMNSSPM